MLELLSSGVQASSYPDGHAHLESEPTPFKSFIRTPTTRSAAISSVDKEIEAARHHILTLLTRRNSLAPISLLPPELLARIFHFHAAFERSSYHGETLGRIRVTHVCRYWRQVALEDSTLWARFSRLPPSTTCLAEMLDRAKGAPLVIDLDNPRDSKTLSMFSSHLSHIRELRLRNLPDSLTCENSIQELCSLEAPMLEHFEFEGRSVSPVVVPPSVGAKFFNGQAPKLRTFSLCQVQIPWSLVPRTQLSQLRIVLYEETSTGYYSPLSDTSNQLIDVLTNNPALEDLVLQFCLPPMLSHVCHDQTIHLPRLSHLGLAASSSRVAHLLKMLKLPSSTKLHLNCVSETLDTQNNGIILPLISAHFNRPNPVTFKSFVLTLDYMGRSIGLTASSSLPTSTTSRSHTFECGLEGDAELCLSFHNFGHLPDTVERVCTMFPMAEVEFFSISTPDGLDSIDWGGFFRRCEKITTIDICGHGTTTLLQALTPPKPRGKKPKGKRRKREGDRNARAAEGVDSTAPNESPVFPKLTTLFMRELNFAEQVPRCGNLYDVLMNALRRRRLHKVPLKKLSIDDSIISTKRSCALEREVQDFHCGKYETFSCDDYSEFDEHPELTDEEDDRWGGYFLDTPNGEWGDWENYSDYSMEYW